MFQKNVSAGFWVSILVFALALAPSAYAGKVELTTYYPSAYGEYTTLKSTTDASFATTSGNVGIGTASPLGKLEVAGITSTSAATSISRISHYSNAVYLTRSDNVGKDALVFRGTDAIGAAIESGRENEAANWNTYFAFYTSPGGPNTDSITEKMRITGGGNVGIGVTGPTVQFERACPSGFTNVKAGNNQLGCMQTAEAGSGAWETASDYCFDNYGGRLATTGEWYIAMANYALTDETDDWEWNNDPAYGIDIHACSGASAITSQSYTADASAFAFRCWIPK